MHYDPTPTDKLHRLRQRADTQAAAARHQHPSQPEPLELGAVGFLAALNPGADDVHTFECQRCGALTTYDGCDVHAMWHELLEAQA